MKKKKKKKRASASYGCSMAHHQQKSVTAENELESSSSSSSSSTHLLLHSSPTASFYTNSSIFCFKHKPKLFNNFSTSSYSSTWHRFKNLCFASLPLMDSSSSLPPFEFKRNKYNNSGQLKRDELEREVSVLKKMLAHEQRVHEYLEGLHHRRDGSALNIPNFLPPKMKEILAELAMVENEITRLESQMKQLQDDVRREKEERKYKDPHNDEKVAFESKALHFITKAIKGDYHITKHLHQQPPPYRNKRIKPPSPMRDPRHPTPTPRRDRVMDVPSDYPSRVLSTPLHTEEESIHRWSPNKLSENIMKCLVFIYVRLLRTCRVMELEKSGSIARSTNFSLSFRAEANSKTSLMLHKDSRQQDPYGIFDSEASIPRDVGPYKNLVRFTSTSMDFKCIHNSSSLPLFQKLKVLMDGLQKVDLRFLSHQQKLAFWINMYNACIMHGFLQYGVPSVLNHETLLALINKATLNIAGNTINAQTIENFILRKPQDSIIKEILCKDKNSKEMIVNEVYGLETPDPNVIFALCCGTRSSPAVKIYTAEGVTAELERSKLEYLQAAIMVSGAKKIALPELLLANMNDFAGDKEALMEWVCQQLPTSGSLRKSIVDCFRGTHGGKGSTSAAAAVEKIPYEFEFQYLLVVS